MSHEYAESGDCVFRDIDGDAWYERYTGGVPDGDTPARGRAMITGSTVNPARRTAARG